MADLGMASGQPQVLLLRSSMTEQESRSFFLGAAVAAALFIGGSMIREALSADVWHSRIVSVASHFQEVDKEQK